MFSSSWSRIFFASSSASASLPIAICNAMRACQTSMLVGSVSIASAKSFSFSSLDSRIAARNRRALALSTGESSSNSMARLTYCNAASLFPPGKRSSWAINRNASVDSGFASTAFSKSRMASCLNCRTARGLRAKRGNCWTMICARCNAAAASNCRAILEFSSSSPSSIASSHNSMTLARSSTLRAVNFKSVARSSLSCPSFSIATAAVARHTAITDQTIAMVHRFEADPITVVSFALVCLFSVRVAVDMRTTVPKCHEGAIASDRHRWSVRGSDSGPFRPGQASSNRT